MRDVVVAHELLAALELQLCIDLSRLGPGEGGARLLDGRFVGCLLDAEQQVALLNQLSFGEIALLDEAGYPRDEVNLVDCRDPPDVIVDFRYLTAHHRCHGNGRRRRGALAEGDPR